MSRDIKIVEKELEAARKKSNEAFQNAPLNMDYIGFMNYMESSSSIVEKLSREYRLLAEPEFEDIPSYGDVFSLESFIENCKDGGFIDEDGSGNYARDGKMSDIGICPSDVRYDTIRDDFDTVVWFNK